MYLCRASDDPPLAEDAPAPIAAELPASVAADNDRADAIAMVSSLDDVAQGKVDVVMPEADTADAPAPEQGAKPSNSAEPVEEANVTVEEPMQQ